MFTVAMCTHNQSPYVARAVKSVSRQSWRDWELILIDDGSTDETAAMLDDLCRDDSRIRLIHQTHMGLAASRNRCLQLSRGRWITYLDSDDLWLPGALAGHAAYIADHESARFIYGYYHRLRGRTLTRLTGEYQDRPTGTRELFARMFLTPMCVCHRRELTDLAGGFDPWLKYCDDYDLFLRMSLHCRFEPTRRVVGLRRRHGQNMSRPAGRSLMVEAEVLRRFAEQHGPGRLTEEEIAARLGRKYYASARQFFKEGAHDEAFAAGRRAMALAPSGKCALVCVASGLLAPLRRRPRWYKAAG